MSRRDTQRREVAVSRRWLSELDDTGASFKDDSFGVDLGPSDRSFGDVQGHRHRSSGKKITFKDGFLDSGSSDSSETGRAVLRWNHTPSTATAFGERNWSRSTPRRGSGLQLLDPKLGFSGPHRHRHFHHHPRNPPIREGDNYRHMRSPRGRGREARRPIVGDWPLQERGNAPETGTKDPGGPLSPVTGPFPRKPTTSGDAEDQPRTSTGLDKGPVTLEPPPVPPVRSPQSSAQEGGRFPQQSAGIPSLDVKPTSGPEPFTSDKGSEPVVSSAPNPVRDSTSPIDLKIPSVSVPGSQSEKLPEVPVSPSAGQPAPILPVGQQSPSGDPSKVIDAADAATDTTPGVEGPSIVAPVVSDPVTTPFVPEPTAPIIPRQTEPPLASLYLLAPAGHDNHVRNPSSGLSTGSVPKDHVLYTTDGSQSGEFLRVTGPILFNDFVDPGAIGDHTVELAVNDLMRKNLASTWNPEPLDETEAAPEAPTTFLQGFSITLQCQAEMSFEITNLTVKVAKDSTAKPLIFSTEAKVLNEEFEVGFGTSKPASSIVATAASSAQPSDLSALSGIRRCPGSLILGLVSSSDNGGFLNLGDLCDLANLSPKPWLKMLLKATTITFGNLAGTPARNAIWYVPGSGAQCNVRLEASVSLVDGIVSKLDKYISGWKSELPYISAIVRRAVVPMSGPWGSGYVEGELVLAIEPKSVDGVPNGLGVFVGFGSDEIKLMLVCYSEKLQWAFLKKWLMTCCEEVVKAIDELEETLLSVRSSSSSSSSTASSAKASTQTSSDDIDHIMWRKVTVTLGNDAATGKLTLAGIALELEANFQFLVTEGKHVVFPMEFKWDRVNNVFSGECYFDACGPSLGMGEPPLQYRWDYERWETLPYLVPSEPYMSLRHLSTTFSENLPFGVPTEIVSASLFVSNEQLRLRGQLQALMDKPPLAVTDSTSPNLQIDWAMLDLDLLVKFSSKPKTFEANAGGAIVLRPFRPGEPSTSLQASFSYASSNGRIAFNASATLVPMTILHSLFREGQEREHAMSILEHITLKTFSLNIERSKDAPLSLKFSSVLEISGVVLKADYIRASADTWLFDAKLEPLNANAGASPKELNLGEAIAKLLGPEVADIIPEFVTKTKLKMAQSDDHLNVICSRIKEPNCLVFGADIKFGMIHVQFAQIAPITAPTPSSTKASTDKDVGDSKKAPEKQSNIKKLIRVSVGPLPSVPKLPVVGDLEMPFDALEFLWLSAPMSKAELGTLNTNVSSFQKEPIAMGETDVELLQGFHFRLVRGGNVFLDHIFDRKDPKKPSTEKKEPSGSVEGKAPVLDTSSSTPSAAPVRSSDESTDVSSTGGSSAATSAVLDKKKGPLTLSGVSLSFESGKLRIHLDASVLIGPIGAGVQGLNLILDVGKINGLQEILHAPLEVQIEGFDMSFDRSPVTVAGALYHKPDTKAYYGGIAISFSKLSVAAMGMYSQIDADPKTSTPAYDSFFVYGMAEGLIFTVGWAEGFQQPDGFNMKEVITALTGPDAYMTPSMGSLWMALGLVIRACEVIDMRAVATLALGPDQTDIGLLGRATASLPRGSSADDALMLIDLSVIGKLDLVHGELAVDGLINPTSFILAKACRPTGGFSIRSWFGNSPYQGDWVVSFGGYHPQFKVPAHYPVPPRLGISWNLGSNLRVTGNAYAAVTPGAIMAGGLLQAVFSAGPLGAHFDAHADFLVNLKPLYYSADMAVSAGVYYEIRVWFVRKKISVDIGASLHLEGPPIGGEVRFDLCVVSFSVNFGAGRGGGFKAIKLAELMDLVLQPQGNRRNGSVINDSHTFAIISGLLGDASKTDDEDPVKPKTTSQKDRWVVRSDNFLFQVRSAVPLTDAKINQASGTGASYSGKRVISRPMHMKMEDSGIKSEMSVKIRRVGSQDPLPFKAIARIEDKLPANYWGRHSDNPGDYLRPDPKTMPSTIDHLVGMTIVPPTPKRSEHSIPVFKAVGDSIQPRPWKPEALANTTTRFVDDSAARDSVKWSRVKGAMSTTRPVRAKHVRLQREQILDSFVALAHPSTDAPTQKIQDAYRRIGCAVPSVVLNDPARFYISPPTTFSN